MANSKSLEVVVTDSMSEDKSESFNVINIHSKTAGLGFGLLCGILCLYLVFKGWRRFCLAPCKARKVKRKDQPPQPPAISLEMPDLHMREEIKCWRCPPSTTYPTLHKFQGKAFPAQLDDFHHPSQALPSLGCWGRRVASLSPPARRRLRSKSPTRKAVCSGGGRTPSPF